MGENGFSMYKVTCKVIQNLTNLFKHMPIEANEATTTKSSIGTSNSLKLTVMKDSWKRWKMTMNFQRIIKIGLIGIGYFFKI